MSLIHNDRRVMAVCLLLAGSLMQPIASASLLDAPRRSPQTPATEWQRYMVSEEEFSVMLPVTPAMTTQDTYIDQSSSRRERIIGAYSNGAVYAVYTFEKKSLSIEDLIIRFAGKNGLPRPNQPATALGSAGLSLKGETDDRTVVIQFFATAKNFYVFQAVCSKLSDPGGIARFISSIKFSKRPEGRPVTEGVGERPADESEGVQKAEGPQNESQIFSPRDVTRKVSVITKPEPRYTEEARKNQITGSVVLRAVFSSSGDLNKIIAVSKLPDGLTEQAIGAAKQIKFIPAIKDGKFVSTWIELQYNFNLF